MKGVATRCNSLTFGEFGLQAMQPGWIDTKQLEAARIAMTRFIKRGGKIWIRIFPDKPYTKHPAESRMGKGKGIPEGTISASGKGETELMVQTGDGVKEPQNRRATIDLH